MENKSGKLGLIVRMDETGLGIQTRNLAYMLKPDKLLIIDSSPFNGNKQHPEWYEGWANKKIVKGFPKLLDFRNFLQGIDTLLTCETPYGYELFSLAKRAKVKTFLQYNYEFLDYLQSDRLPKPTCLISPSEWHMEDVWMRTGEMPHLLPPPLFMQDFQNNRQVNLKRDGSFIKILHVGGKAAVNDRNGTGSVVEAAEMSKSKFKLVIKSQTPIENKSNDPRIFYDFNAPENNADLYLDYDLVIMPRRYGGLCLPVNEAMASALPVIMTNIAPNNHWMPKEWLVQASKTGEFMTRTMINIYSASPKLLAKKIDEFCTMTPDDLDKHKLNALELAMERFNADRLRPKYKEFMGL